MESDEKQYSYIGRAGSSIFLTNTLLSVTSSIGTKALSRISGEKKVPYAAGRGGGGEFVVFAETFLLFSLKLAVKISHKKINKMPFFV